MAAEQALRQFIAIVEAGNVTAAARRLGVSQPSLTKYLRRLEERFGAKLLERLPRGVVVTPSGSALYRHAKNIEAEMRFAEESIGHLKSGQTSALRLGAGALWSIAHCPILVRRLTARYPSIQLDVVVGTRQALLPKLMRRDLDFALCGIQDRLDDARIGVEPLLAVATVVVGRKDHPLQRLGAPDWGALGAFDWICYQNSLDFAVELARVFELRGLPPPRTAVRTDSWTTGVLIAAQTDNLMCVPQQLVPFAQQLGLDELRMFPPLHSFEAGLFFNKQALELPAGRFFLRLVREISKDQCNAD